METCLVATWKAEGLFTSLVITNGFPDMSHSTIAHQALIYKLLLL